MARCYEQTKGHIIRDAMGWFYHVFACRSCALPIWFRAEMLGGTFGPPALRTMDAPSVAFVCPHCKQVQSRSLRETSPDYDQTGSTVFSEQFLDTVPFGWLQCGCKTPLPLFGVTMIPTDSEEWKKERMTWKLDGLALPTWA